VLHILPALICFKSSYNLNCLSTSIIYTPFNKREVVKHVPLVLPDKEE